MAGDYYKGDFGGASGRNFKARKAHKANLRSGQAEASLGVNRGEVERAANTAATGASQQVAAQQREMTRQNMGSGVQASGAAGVAQRGLAKQAASAGAAAKMSAHDIATQAAEARKQRAYALTERERERRRQNSQYAGELALKGVEAASSVAGAVLTP
jgi:hypothetical protein